MAVTVLVVGVVAARDGSAAEEADLRPPPPEEPPSPVPSLPDGGGPLVVEADGVPRARLGTAGEQLEDLGTAFSPATTPGDAGPGGCVQAYPTAPWLSGEQLQGELAWLVDGEVVSVALVRWEPGGGPEASVRTWLGPTLGSPLAEAEALPGAEVRTERPSGADGPTVRVVTVPGRDAEGREVEAVFSDAHYRPLDRDPDVPRVETLEVRLPEAAACSSEAEEAEARLAGAAQAAGQGPAPVLAIGEQGLEQVPLGTPAEVLETLDGFAREGGGAGCEAWSGGSADGWARVVVVDGRVVEGSVAGTGARSTLPVGLGASVDEVVAAYPGLAGQVGTPEGQQVSVALEGRVVVLDLQPTVGWVPDVDVPVFGGPLEVAGLTVRDAAAPSGYC